MLLARRAKAALQNSGSLPVSFGEQFDSEPQHSRDMDAVQGKILGSVPRQRSDVYPTAMFYNWTIVPGISVGPIRLGMTAADVEALLDEADERTVFEEERTVYLSYLGLGLCIRLIDEAVEGVLAYSGRKGGHETMNWSRFEGAFACGLNFDARAEDVIKHFGPPEHSGSLPDAPIPSNWTSYPSRGVGFDFIEATGEMIYITIFVPRDLSKDEL